MVLTVYFVLSPAIGLFCHRRLTDIGGSAPGRAAFASARLDTSVEMSGPHDLTVRVSAVRQLAVDNSRASAPALPSRVVPDAARVHRIPPRVRDVAQRPSEWGGTAREIQLIWVF